MKKSTLAVFLLVATAFSFLFQSTAAINRIVYYYKDATYGQVVGAVGYGTCRELYGVKTPYYRGYSCD